LQQSVVFKYDAFGNRIEKDVTVGSTTTTQRYALDGWDPAKAGSPGNAAWDVWADLDGSNHLTTRYFRGDVVDQLFARIDSGTSYWELTDRQGSIRTIIDNTATVKDQISYDGWGNASQTASTYGGRYLYTGREWDVETGLQYDHARYYDPTTSRWISQDPLGFDAGDSNLYRYVNNAPTLAIDQSGLQVQDQGPQGAAALGKAVGKVVGLAGAQAQAAQGVAAFGEAVAERLAEWAAEAAAQVTQGAPAYGKAVVDLLAQWASQAFAFDPLNHGIDWKSLQPAKGTMVPPQVTLLFPKAQAYQVKTKSGFPITIFSYRDYNCHVYALGGKDVKVPGSNGFIILGGEMNRLLTQSGEWKQIKQDLKVGDLVVYKATMLAAMLFPYAIGEPTHVAVLKEPVPMKGPGNVMGLDPAKSLFLSKDGPGQKLFENKTLNQMEDKRYYPPQLAYREFWRYVGPP
jgi:RHS repeat-associated protein